MFFEAGCALNHDARLSGDSFLVNGFSMVSGAMRWDLAEDFLDRARGAVERLLVTQHPAARSLHAELAIGESRLHFYRRDRRQGVLHAEQLACADGYIEHVGHTALGMWNAHEEHWAAARDRFRRSLLQGLGVSPFELRPPLHVLFRELHVTRDVVDGSAYTELLGRCLAARFSWCVDVEPAALLQHVVDYNDQVSGAWIAGVY